MTNELTLRRPDDWHLHLRDGEMMKTVLPFSSREYARAIVMPNLTPPLKKTKEIAAYRERILAALPQGHHFTPLMTLYLSDDTDPKDLLTGFNQKIVQAVKWYPAHATTNSAYGVSAVDKISSVLETMQRANIPLLIHGEVTQASVDIFDREARFVDDTLMPLVRQFPALRVVLEHVTTTEAATFVRESSASIAATVTPQHLLLNRNALFQGGIRPHHYCLPILKRERHRQALVQSITSGGHRFFLGTDSAPHERHTKETRCGCAGVFNAPVALAVYASIFEQANALDKLEAFTSLNGPQFYGLPPNKEKVTLVKQIQVVPEAIVIPGVGSVVPFLAGETLSWSVKY